MNQTLETDCQLNSFRICQVYVKANYEKGRLTHLSELEETKEDNNTTTQLHNLKTHCFTAV